MNAAFIEIFKAEKFSTDEMVDFERAVTISLPANDPPPPAPVDEIIDAEVVEGEVCEGCGEVHSAGPSGPDDILGFTDGDGDRVQFGYFHPSSVRYGALVIHVNGVAMILPLAEIPLLAEWLVSRYQKAVDVYADEAADDEEVVE